MTYLCSPGRFRFPPAPLAPPGSHQQHPGHSTATSGSCAGSTRSCPDLLAFYASISVKKASGMNSHTTATEPPEHKNMFFTREKDTHMRQQTLRQWFLTLFTYLTLLSNNITRFTPNTLGGGHLLKIRNSTNSYSLE